MADTFTFRADNARINRGLLRETTDRLKGYVDHLQNTSQTGGYSEPEGSINLPADEEIQSNVEQMVDRVVTDDLEYVVVVGIGGSNLGALAVYEALRGTFSTLETDQPRILFADTVDPEKLSSIASALQQLDRPEQFLVNIVTKSGSTTETISNFEYLFDVLGETFDHPERRVVGTTDEGSKLWQVARAKEFPCLRMPSNVGGRFSVLSAVGQFPLRAAGIDVDALLEGAAAMKEACLAEDPDDNPALTSAALLYLYYQRGIDIYNSFFFNPQMESVGKWYRQLMGESIGKQYNEEHQQVRTGITPLVSIGSTDLHSMAQLYFGGPRDKFTTLIYAPTTADDVQLPNRPFLGEAVEGIYGKDIRSIMTAIYEGVRATYQKEELPFTEIVLDDLSASSIGAYLQYNMISIMMLADLLDINAFNQPNVEGYKEETRKRL
jgi:glucose-6-phosphate isomerase